ncbi:tyrosine-protein phosphatase non-receptor type substrate 1-like [Scyliorhinus torazame]|uniref:tyrosine-protein phosphatase non-receptor type substrate 1-like n=1 Tax=Scyliorhinus torazame TaxID=75743 RepID=UPI003B59D461
MPLAAKKHNRLGHVSKFRVRKSIFPLPFDVRKTSDSRTADRASFSVSQAPEEVAVSRGGNVTFYCIFPIFKEQSWVRILWWKHGENQYLRSSAGKRKRFGKASKVSGFFQLLGATFEDAGIYHCSVIRQGLLGRNGTGSHLIVHVAAHPLLEVTQIPENIYSFIGTNIAFDCTFLSFQDDSDANVYWWKLGEKQMMHPGSESRKRFVTGNGKASFKLLNISVQDSGVYYCGVAQENRAANGSGSTLIVSALPTPVKIVPHVSESNVPGSLTLLCEMASFHPAGLTITWYKNNESIATGINTTKQLSRAGMYEAWSYFEDAQPIREGTVYICLVSHVTLQIPAMASYTVPNCNPGRGSRIFGYTRLALTFVILMTTIIMLFKFSDCKVRRQRTQAILSSSRTTDRCFCERNLLP